MKANEEILSYYEKYEKLRGETTSDPAFRGRVKALLATKFGDELQNSLKEVKIYFLKDFREKLKPELDAIFDRFDEDANGVLDPAECKLLVEAFLLGGKELRVKHTIATKLNAFPEKVPDLLKLIDSNFIKANGRSTVSKIIKDIYEERYVPWCTQFYDHFFNDILNNIDSFTKSLIEDMDKNHDNSIEKDELVEWFTIAFANLTSSGNASFIRSETQWLNHEFNVKIDTLVKERLAERSGRQIGVTDQCSSNSENSSSREECQCLLQ